MKNGILETEESRLLYAFVCEGKKCLSEYSTFAELLTAFDNWILTEEGQEMRHTLKKLFADKKHNLEEILRD